MTYDEFLKHTETEALALASETNRNLAVGFRVGEPGKALAPGYANASATEARRTVRKFSKEPNPEKSQPEFHAIYSVVKNAQPANRTAIGPISEHKAILLYAARPEDFALIGVESPYKKVKIDKPAK